MMRRFLPLLLIASLLLSLWPVRGEAQGDRAQETLDAMSVEARVGQLFIVSFVGREFGSSSDIAQLIREEQVGGVVLLAANQNFVNDASAPMQVRESTQGLQALALEKSPLPLLIAIDHEGDGWPYSRLTGGTTPLPSPMAVGATWNLELARQVGQITGQEMAAAGINMILGPTVDVLSTPRSTTKGDLGTRIFGGDPYWVGRMGRAYITGIHEGSSGRTVTVAKHFPGHGGSDRLPDDEVATVDKSLQELRRIELAPFFAVTRFDTPEDPAVTDALMSSHIRYRGFQGNIRQFTAPISFDPQGLRTILSQQEFAEWQQRGVIVSDSLGVPAVKRYFDPTGQTFPHRQIARDALMAGNDLLILAQFAREDAWHPQLDNMRDTLAYFREQYRSDRTFATRVDEAALRVVRMKLKLYPEFEGGEGLLPPLPEPRFGEGGEVTQAVAEQSLTLLFPRTLEELNERLPRAPLRGEPIVIFTDSRRVRDCFDCPYYALLPTDALQKAILRRYGPQGTNQIAEAQIISFSFDDLKLFLGVPEAIESSENPEAQARADAVRALVENAQWIILAMQDINLSPMSGTQVARYPESDAARLMLDAAASSLFNKRVVAFAFNVPYQLDTTEISKLSAAYALYSKQEAFVEVAARALFREIVPQGAPPVTVEAINYDLPTQLSPAPNQPITLERLSEEPLLAPTEVEVQSSIIVDRNGHPVPDGTSVEIIGAWRDQEEAVAPRVQSSTVDGVARATLRLRLAGTLEVTIIAAQARSESPLVLTVVGPTPVPTSTSESLVVAQPTATAKTIAGAPELNGATPVN
ncbi:MAG: glycoside hydrolase family 3 protein, partial [Ardenticatenales bacterium]|nr:glycoside hydrolase family 3 protein [Ardenticatenales bacterium]